MGAECSPGSGSTEATVAPGAGSRNGAGRQSARLDDRLAIDPHRGATVRPPRSRRGLHRALTIEPLLNDDQYDRMMGMRDEWDRRQEERERWRENREQYQQMVEELPDQLQMNDTQREEFNRFVEQRRGRFRSRMAEMRPLWEQMGEARQAGDEARMEELRHQLEDMRPPPEQMREEFLKELEEFLPDNQKPLLAEYAGQAPVGVTSAPARLRTLDVRDVLSAARRVRMEREQRRQLRLIAREAIKQDYQIRRRDNEAQQKLAQTLTEKITGILNDEQKEEFDTQLERLRSSRRTR
jgi:hypothetical protein